MSVVRLNAREHKILDFLVAEYSAEGGFYSFAPLASETGLDKREVRLACRSLRRKGLAEFKAGLWTEEGELYGSGYGASKAGRELIINGMNTVTTEKAA